MAYAYPEDVHRLYIISYGIPVCPQGSQISANLMKSFKMTNFAPCGPIFKIRNSKQVYSKSYNQISDCIFLKPAISRQTSCKQIKSLIANLKSCLKVPCVPTVQCLVSFQSRKVALLHSDFEINKFCFPSTRKEPIRQLFEQNQNKKEVNSTVSL